MNFYLDKESARQGVAKCIAVSENEINKEELEERKRQFEVRDVLVFIGDDIPHRFIFNEVTDNIEELQEVEVDNPQTYFTVEKIEELSIFDESVTVEPNTLYFYIDKNIADTKGLSEIKATFDKPLLNPLEYFGLETYTVKGDNVPCYVSVDGGVVREATDYEKYTRGQRELAENEVVFKEDIVILEDGQYIDEAKREIISVTCPPEYIIKDWDRDKHIWVDLTSDLDRVNEQYSEYESMDKPSVNAEMGTELATEVTHMLIQLREMKYQLTQAQSSRGRRRRSLSTIDLPEPSEALKEFKDKFNIIKGVM